jgi:hypothetical protein
MKKYIAIGIFCLLIYGIGLYFAHDYNCYEAGINFCQNNRTKFSHCEYISEYHAIVFKYNNGDKEWLAL